MKLKDIIERSDTPQGRAFDLLMLGLGIVAVPTGLVTAARELQDDVTQDKVTGPPEQASS
jgi:hypothetical protein